MPNSTKPILFVDDEQNVLDGIRRQLRKQFNIDTALGGEEGLKRIRSEVSYAVVISDMRMPGMNGIEFLNHVAAAAPNTVRMMLTGNSDQQTAIDAVNKGNIFRFLNKPCSAETLTTNLEAGIRQYDLINAEKELLEKTLKGSISALVNILALTNPVAFSRAERIKYYTTFCTKEMKLPEAWKYEVAAMLSQIGYVTIPTDIMEKSLAGDELNENEQSMVKNHAQEACQMLDQIPRLEDVSKMIAGTNSVGGDDPGTDSIMIGSQLLHTATEFDTLISRGSRAYQAIQQMQEDQQAHNPAIINALKNVSPPSFEKTVCCIPINKLRIGMVLAEDIRSSSNAMIVSKGQVVSGLMHRRLENFLQQKAIDDKVRVYEERQVFNA